MFYWRLNRSFNTRNYYHVSVKAIDWLSEWVKCAAFRKLYSLFLKRRHFQINVKHFLLFFLYFLCSLWKETRDKHPPRWRYQAYDTRKSIWTSLPSGKYVLYEYLFLEILVLRLAYVRCILFILFSAPSHHVQSAGSHAWLFSSSFYGEWLLCRSSSKKS